jgi:ABC-type branched-subunit amino acid transport system permease subunit
VSARPARPRRLWDPGAQPERTYQSWARTVLACVVCALLLTRLTGRAGVPALALAAAVAAGALGLLAAQRRRLAAGSLRPAPLQVAALTVLVLATALGGVALVLAG